MIRRITGIAFLLLAGMLCSQAHATHIQYVSLANVNNVVIGSGDTWTWTFDLLNDSMFLWELASPTDTFGPTPDVATADYMGSYDPDSNLHYVTLRIDPNNYTGDPTSDYISLKVNGFGIASWSNPVSLYDWGVPGGSVSDAYDIASNDYKITVSLTGLESLGSKELSIQNLNLEGCFDTAIPVPEPATMLLLIPGLAGLAETRRKLKK